jgi:hypothetical protein
MSEAARCDRCGKFAKVDAAENFNLNLKPSIPKSWLSLSWEAHRPAEMKDLSSVGRVDLCFECRTDFTKFMQHYIDLARG